MNPYETLPETAFWKPAVAARPPLEIADLWQPAFRIAPADTVVTYGSCFAQHIGRALKARGYRWRSFESAPAGMAEDSARRFGYDIFSSRTANIYTATLLRQWVSWASGEPVPGEVWTDPGTGRVFDPFRPAIEPGGFASAEEMRHLRDVTIAAFRESIETARVFVFTLGLTESWFDAAGHEYPMCPGTLAGSFDPARHRFVNQDFATVRSALVAAMSMMRRMNRRLRFLLTVSPVPLTATCSGRHVLTATVHSKSILRAVAGQLAAERSDTDYFPSYEIITSPVFGGRFYEANRRSVTAEGVGFVMDSFFRCLAGSGAPVPVPGPAPDSGPAAGPAAAGAEAEARAAEDVQCEEEVLQAFAGGPAAPAGGPAR